MRKSMTFLCALLLVGAASMMTGRVQAASMAVLVVGMETDAASDAFAAGIRYEYTQKGYTMVNDAVVQAKLAELRKDYKDGNTVDTVGLAAWGKTNSIDFVQLVVEKGCDITISGREQLAQVVTCGTEKYIERAYYRTRFVAQGAMPCDWIRIVEEMMGGMVYVAGGVFQIGCVSGRDSTCRSDETAHWVQVNSFNIGAYEVTQELWEMVMGDLPASLKNNSICLGAKKAVGYIRWNDIEGSGGFLEKLNAQTGKNYRLPTEAEWEYAARGCSGGVCENYAYSGSNTVEDVAWYKGNRPDSSPQPVGGKSPNRLGLYDMNGNVWECCSDWYNAYYGADSSSVLSSTTQATPIVNPQGPPSGSIRVYRSGTWYDDKIYCRIAYRHGSAPSHRFCNFGFRLVLP